MRRERSVHFIYVFAVIALLLANASPAQASGGIDPKDPMVRITYVPIKKDVSKILANVSQEVTKATGIAEEYITYYWQTFDSIHCMGKKATDRPIFVDLYVPGFFTDEQVADLMVAIADSLQKNVGIEKKWVFIHTHFPLQGQVYISGHVEYWDNYRGKKTVKPRPLDNRALDKFLFNDASFVFQSLWRFGVTATGGSDLGELLTIVSSVKDGDHASWYNSWNSMARRVYALAEEFAASGNAVSAQEAYFRATNYFRVSEIFLPHDDPRGLVAWQNGRNSFLKAAQLSNGRIEYVRIPYEKTTLPGYFCKVDNSGKKRPLLLIQTGLDGTAEDLYFIIATQALKRGYNCLVYEGPGQGEMIRIQKLPFRHDWEKVVTPVVDFALRRPEVDAEKLAILGYSMGGYLVPRAVAYEPRIKYCIADGGVFSVFDGLMTKFPAEVKAGVGKPGKADMINRTVLDAMKTKPDISQFINQMLWTFKTDTPNTLFRKLKHYSMQGSVDKIKCETLVLNSSNDQVAGSNAQAKILFNALKTRKSYLEFTAAHGAQLHCQMGAPLIASERILNWLDTRMKP